jgi:hypothetical protein
LTPREIARLFQPYVSQRFLDQFKTVAPLAAYLVLFQLLFLRQLVQDSWLITGGLLALILGLMFFKTTSIQGPSVPLARTSGWTPVFSWLSW